MSYDVVIEARGVTKSFGPTQALRGVDLVVGAGEVVAVMGPSGSGKSTLLHVMAGIVDPDDGEVTYAGRRIDHLPDAARSALRRNDFGFVFQLSHLVPELTALDNVAVPLLLNGTPRRAAYARATDWLARVELSDVAGKLPGQLSGGQAQRIAVARSMVAEPRVLFADEPTGSLDSLNSEHVMELFIAAAKTRGATVVLVTHEPTIAAYADREVVVRDGRIAAGYAVGGR